MSCGLDIGTMWLCKSEIDKVDDTGVSFTLERNVFAEVRDNLDNPEEILRENNYAYVKYKDSLFVVGEDVFKVHEIESLFKKSGAQSYFSDVRRPMKNGLLNTAEDKLSIAIIQEIIKKLVGKPSSPGEILCFCVPGDPVNSSNNVLFHKMVLTSFVQSLGFTPECINEALAIIYSENPTSTTSDGETVKFTGVSLSFGDGMCNACMAFKQLPLLTFSVEHCGAWIDEEAAKVAGCDKPTMTKYKEKYLNLSKIDASNIKELALDTYYQAMIRNVLINFAAKFEKLDQKLESSLALEIVVAGGTSLVPGFMDKFNEVLSTVDLPFKVKGVRHAKAPLYAVANGCLIRSLSLENKKKKGTEKPKEEDKNKENPPQKIKLNQ